MNSERLKKSNELVYEIDTLTQHLRFFTEVKFGDNTARYKLHFGVYNHVRNPRNEGWKELKEELLSPLKEQFIADYVRNLENEILRLQLEFDNL